MARDDVTPVRVQVRVRDQSTRTLDQRLAIRFPRLSAALARQLFKLPPSSRLRQAMLKRVIQLGAEAYNRRDLEAVVINYDPEIEYYPYREFVDARLAEPSTTGRRAIAPTSRPPTRSGAPMSGWNRPSSSTSATGS